MMKNHSMFKSEQRQLMRALKASGIDMISLCKPEARYAFIFGLYCWAIVTLGIYIWPKSPVLSFLIFSIAQHTMLVLTHEAAHGHLFRNRFLNTAIGNLVFALPIGQSVESYRAHHEPHHKHLNTDEDTSFFLTDTRRSVVQTIFTLVTLLCGRVVWDLIKRTTNGSRAGEDDGIQPNRSKMHVEIQRLIYLLPLHVSVLAFAYLNSYFALYVSWVFAAITLTPFIDGLRTIAEHRIEAERKDGYGETATTTRSHHRNIFVSLLFSPLFEYHWEHHLLPNIPYSSLRKVHVIALKNNIGAARPEPWAIFGAFAKGIRSYDNNKKHK
jgi:fatty acid desaturase